MWPAPPGPATDRRKADASSFFPQQRHPLFLEAGCGISNISIPTLDFAYPLLRRINYINTDLDLVAPFDLEPLAQALSTRGASPLHVLLRDDGAWFSSLETDESFYSVEPNAAALLAAIERLDSESRRLWAPCALRELNIGYECGDEPYPFTNELKAATLARIAALDISVRITLYPAEAPKTQPLEPSRD